MGAWPPPSGSLPASWPLSCGRRGAPGRPRVMSAGDSGPPPGEAATGCRSPEPRPSAALGESQDGVDPRATWAPRPTPGAAPGRSGSLGCKCRKGRGDGFGDGIAAGQAHSTRAAVCRAKRGCRGARSTWRERQPRARCSASPPAVCSTATRGRCALILHLGRQGLGCGGDPCAFLQWIRRGRENPGLRMHTARRSNGESSQALWECRRSVTPGVMRPP